MSAPDRIWFDPDDMNIIHEANVMKGDVPYLRRDPAVLAADPMVARLLRDARNEGLERAAGLPCATIPYSPELKAALDAVTAYRAAIRNLKEPTDDQA